VATPGLRAQWLELGKLIEVAGAALNGELVVEDSRSHVLSLISTSPLTELTPNSFRANPTAATVSKANKRLFIGRHG